jgi:hypothetical protein
MRTAPSARRPQNEFRPNASGSKHRPYRPGPARQACARDAISTKEFLIMARNYDAYTAHTIDEYTSGPLGTRAANASFPASFLNSGDVPLMQVQDAAAYLKSHTDSVESRATSLEGRATSLEGRATSLEGRATSLESRATAIEGRLNAYYYGTFLSSSCNAGDGFRWTDVYASGITNATVGGSGAITFTTAGIYVVDFSVGGFGSGIAATIQPTYNGSNIAVAYACVANGWVSGSFMVTAVGGQALAFVNQSGGARTPVGTMTIRRVT